MKDGCQTKGCVRLVQSSCNVQCGLVWNWGDRVKHQRDFDRNHEYFVCCQTLLLRHQAARHLIPVELCVLTECTARQQRVENTLILITAFTAFSRLKDACDENRAVNRVNY